MWHTTQLFFKKEKKKAPILIELSGFFEEEKKIEIYGM